MDDGIGLAERLLGLDGFRVLEVTEGPDELVITIETTADFVGCSACGVRAEAHDRMPIAVRDLACFGRPGRLVWVKRRCREPRCEARTWTERSVHWMPRRGQGHRRVPRRRGARDRQPRSHLGPVAS
jgi:hypothetical protein